MYDKKRDFYDGLAAINIGFKDVQTDQIYDPREGYARQTISEGKWGFIDESGTEVVPVIYDEVGNYSEGLALVKLGDKRFFIDKTGKKFHDFEYDTFWGFSEGLGYVRKSGKYGYIDLQCEEVIPLIFDQAFDFIGGLAVVKTNGKYGYIEKSGDFFISPQFDDASRFVGDVARVQKDKKFGIINKKNQEILSCNYDEINFPNNVLIEAVQNDLYKYYNFFGRQITPAYNYSNSFYTGNYCIVGKGDGGKRWLPTKKLKNVKWGIIDYRGVEVIPLNFENYEDVVAEMKKLEQT